MPTKEEMSQAYIVSIESKISEMENQIETLKNHVTECKTALEEGEENEENEEQNGWNPIFTDTTENPEVI